MKSIRPLYTVLLFWIASLPLYSQAQTVTANNESWATLVPGGTCNNCTITIPAGWTLLLNSSGTCNGCTFNGGTVNITSGFTFNNNATNFNNDTVLFNAPTSGYTFNFNNDSVAVNASLTSQNNTSTVSNSRFPNTISCNSGSTTVYANSCTSGYVYGCATLNNAGAVGCMTLALANLSLSATVTGSEAVILSWTDANNANEDNFLVQRSAGSQDWTTIGTVTANEYTTGDYQFRDPAAAAGTNTYRIQVIDKEGHTSYSTASLVTINSTPESIHIYPNPVTSHIFFVATASTRPVIINLFTLSGQLLSRTSLKGQTQYTLQLPASMTPGNYMVVQVIGTESTHAFNLLIK